MNIFSSLTHYGEWIVKNRRNFNEEEINSIDSAVVVPSQYGNSVQFNMVGGGMTFIPLSNQSVKAVGEKVDVASAKLITLSKPGEDDILRVEC